MGLHFQTSLGSLVCFLVSGSLSLREWSDNRCAPEEGGETRKTLRGLEAQVGTFLS